MPVSPLSVCHVTAWRPETACSSQPASGSPVYPWGCVYGGGGTLFGWEFSPNVAAGLSAVAGGTGEDIVGELLDS